MSELNVLFPFKTITVNNEEIVIKPITFGQLPRALQLVEKMSGSFIDAFKKEGEITNETILKFVASGGEDFIKLLCLGINKDRDWFNNLNADDGIDIVIKFVEVNTTFFTQRVIPQIVGLTEKLQKPSGQKQLSL